MNDMTSHYSNAQSPLIMKKWASKTAKTFYDMMKDDPRMPILAYRGMSGVSAATALSMALSNKPLAFMMLYVRKDGEKAHGTKLQYGLHGVEYREPSSHLLCIVDDFVCSGDTLIAISREVRQSRLGVGLTNDSIVVLSTPTDGRCVKRVSSYDPYMSAKLTKP